MNVYLTTNVEFKNWFTNLAALVVGMVFATPIVGQDVSMLGGLTVLERPLENAFIGVWNNAEQVVDTLTTCNRLTPVRVLPQDEVWLVSARQAHLNPCDLSTVVCSRLTNGEWVDDCLANLVAVHSTDKSKVTMMYVHGNRTDLKWAKSRGLQFYQNAMQTCARPPLRLVIFAWKSESELTRLIPDFKIKSDRSVDVGIALGRLLGQFGDRNMVLGGFSLGAQVVLQAVSDPDLQLNGYGQYRVAIFAPALNPSFVQSGLSQYPHNPIVERTEVFVNHDDRAVKVSQLIARKRTDSYVSTLSQLAATSGFSFNVIHVNDITAEITNKHSIVKYSSSLILKGKLSELLSAPFALPIVVNQNQFFDAVPAQHFSGPTVIGEFVVDDNLVTAN